MARAAMPAVPSSGGINLPKLILGLLFLFVGVLRVLTLLNIEAVVKGINLIGLIPEPVLSWILAIGAIIGGAKLVIPSRAEMMHNKFKHMLR